VRPKLEELIAQATEATETDAPPVVLLREELRKRGGVYARLAVLIRGHDARGRGRPEFGKARAPQVAPPTQMRMLAWEDLPAKGIYFHRNYLRRLWEEGRFPKPIHLSARKLAWPETAIDEWIENKIKLANYKVG
jgi:predicted DNA-binding transcriptional regulator AlpA